MKEILKRLKEIEFLLSKYSERDEIPKIELDIILEKIRFVYSNLILQDIDKETINKIEVLIKKEIDESINNKIETDSSIIEIEKEEKSIEEEVNIIKKDREKHSETKTIADAYNKSEILINELLASRLQKKDLTTIMQTKPIKDLEAAIDINDKFLFIRELFNGDKDTYDKTIRILNSSQNFNQAFNYINSTFDWDYETEAAHKLLDLVRRRYIIDSE